MSTTLTTTEPRRPTSLRAAVRRLFALASSGQATSAGRMFDRAQNTSIQHATFTINQYGGIVADHPHASAATAEGQQPREGTSASSSRQEYDPSSSPRRESPDVYVDCLLTEKRGYPLWIPSPSTTLPVLNRKLGVSLGDVGVLTPEGGFDFLFNIFYSATHPINAVVGVPEGFVCFSQPLGSGHVEFVEWNAGSYLANPRMASVNDGSDPLKTVLESRVFEAAVLMIPEEIRATRMRETASLRTYVEENAAAWYKFVKHTLRYDIENGDLRVVYGCRKSSGFGIATTFNNTRLTFRVDRAWARTSGCPYRWSHTGTAEVKAGPYQQENPDISSAESDRNQCLFVNTIAAKVSAGIWKCIEELEIIIGTPIDLDSNPTSSMAQSSDVSTQAPTVKSDTRGIIKTPSSAQYGQRVFQPSVILHDILETMAPGARVYTVCDDDWAPFLTNKNMDVCDFVNQVLRARMIIERDGAAYLCEEEWEIAKYPSVTKILCNPIKDHGESYRLEATCIKALLQPKMGKNSKRYKYAPKSESSDFGMPVGFQARVPPGTISRLDASGSPPKGYEYAPESEPSDLDMPIAYHARVPKTTFRPDASGSS